MLFRPTARPTLEAAPVYDVFGVQVGRVLRIEPERILIGDLSNQPLMWVRRSAVFHDRNGVTLRCARNRLSDVSTRQ